MTQKGKIITYHHNIASVEIIRNSACSADCEKCGGCHHGTQKILVDLPYDGQLTPGQIVILSVKSSALLKFAQVTYILPIILMIGGYFVGAKWGELAGIGGSFAFLALSYVPIRLLNKSGEAFLKKDVKIIG